MNRFDVVVVGAGPAGSSCALRLARTGARVLMVDRAKFPRDKPCGGAVTGRAALEAPCDFSPVVERVVDVAELVSAGGRVRVRGSKTPIAYMTQRRRLDHHLVEQAQSAGVEFRDGVRNVVVDHATMTATVDRDRCQAAVLVGADGANGTAAKSLLLGEIEATGIALEGNLDRGRADVSRYDTRGVVHFGVMVGGYGWIFPKGDHVNVGVGGWLSEGGQLRSRLEWFCDEYGLPFQELQDVRGHRLPMKAGKATLASERGCLVGDAAGLVDPLTGDGMYECFVSARLAAEHIAELLSGGASNLHGYEQALTRRLRSLHWASWLLKRGFDRFPRATYEIATSSAVWSVMRDLLTGELRDFESAAGRLRPLRLLPRLASG
jgi:geranylgeranyl reductase family protein